MRDSVTDLTSMLIDPTLLQTRAYIAGEWADADDGATFEVTNPARGDVVAHVADLSRTEVARAIDAAETARHAWAARTGKDRAAILRKMHDLMMAHADDLGLILTAEMGKPLAEARGEIAYGASYFEWFARRGQAHLRRNHSRTPTRQAADRAETAHRRGCCDYPMEFPRMP